MDKSLYDNFVEILREELVAALGCTEPIAIAFCAAKARDILGDLPDKIDVYVSGNIIKNVKGVTVPNSGGQKGVDIAAILGVLVGGADKKLEVLSGVSDADIEKSRSLRESGFSTTHIIEGDENLVVIVKAKKGNDEVCVEVKYTHTNITNITKNGEVLFCTSNENSKAQSRKADRSGLSIENILEFANTLDIKDIADVIENQISLNTDVSIEGLEKEYGASIGRSLMELRGGDDVRNRAKAKAAAGSDARMNGAALAVVTNSGSGNQGITVSIPVIEYAKELGVSDDKLYRALVLSNLTAILQKEHIGKLSAFCGVVCAASGAGVGIAYLHDCSYEEMSNIITYTLCTIGGMVCDGAKSSCAAKIAQAVDCAIFGFELSYKAKKCLNSGDGLVEGHIEDTIDNIGRMARVGMAPTDLEILNIMIDN